MAIPELRKQIAEAREAGDFNRVRQLQHQLFIEVAMGSSQMREILRVYRGALDRLGEIVGTLPEGPERQNAIYQVFVNLRQQTPELLYAALTGTGRTVEEQLYLDLEAMLTVPQQRAATGLPIDAYGNPKPEPGEPQVSVIRDPDLPLAEILLIAAPLLFLTGDRYLRKRNPPVREITGPADENVERWLTTPNPSNLDNYSPWYAADINVDPNREAARVNDLLNQGTRSSDVLFEVRTALGLKNRIKGAQRIGEPDTPAVGPQGVARRLQTVLRHVTLEMAGRSRDELSTKISPDIYIGYVLHSVFAETTAPDHANRDGWRFYRDNRPGSNLPWSQRLVPPYRVNCLCFTRELFQDPEGEEFYIEWNAIPQYRGARRIRPSDVGARVWDPEKGGYIKLTAQDVGRVVGRPGAPLLEPRDVATWSEWFDAQNPSIKETLLGRERYFAVLSRGDGAVRYRDVVRPNGSFMSPREIMREAPASKAGRTEFVRDLQERMRRQHTRAFERGEGKWELTPYEESQYRRRLEIFLRRTS